VSELGAGSVRVDAYRRGLQRIYHRGDDREAERDAVNHPAHLVSSAQTGQVYTAAARARART
jgi:hypothetical protein